MDTSPENKKYWFQSDLHVLINLCMQEKSLRYNDGKLDWTLVDFKALEPLVQVLEY
jgi:hypothetical protein